MSLGPFAVDRRFRPLYFLPHDLRDKAEGVELRSQSFFNLLSPTEGLADPCVLALTLA